MPALVRFLIVFGATLAGAATIGKLVPHIPQLAARFDIPLGMAGFLVSSVMLPGVLAGPLFGALVDRVAPKQVALAGLTLGALASVLLPYAANAWGFLSIRLLEGVGYTLLVVAATLLVVQVSAARRRTLALSAFSAFAPIGFALGQLFAAGASDRAVGLGHAGVLVVMLLLVLAAVPGVKPPTMARASVVHALRFPPALRTGIAFGCVAGLLLGAVALAPLVLATHAGTSVEETARLTALAALPGIVGRFLPGWLLGRWAPLRVFVCAAALGALILPFAFTGPLAAALVCFAAFQICMGTLAGILSAMLPQVAPTPAQFGTVTGLANQMVTAGNLVGPPLVLAVFAAAGAGPAIGVLAGTLAAAVWMVSGVEVYRRALAS